MKKFVFPLVFGLTLSGYAVYSVLDSLIIPSGDTIEMDDEENEDEFFKDKNDNPAPNPNEGHNNHPGEENQNPGNNENPENNENPGNTENPGIEQTGEIITSHPDYLRYYKSDDLEVKIYKETVKTKDTFHDVMADTIIFCADVRVSDLSHFRGRFAIIGGKPTYGYHRYSTTSSIAENGNAIFAISGDNYAGREKGYVVRNGKTYRDSVSNSEDLVVWGDGSFGTFKEKTTPLSEITSNPLGAWQVFSFGPALVVDNKIMVDDKTEVTTGIASNNGNQRSVIGIIEPLHYFITISEARLDDSFGQSLYEAATFIKSKGVKTAYNLDGGGSATIWFNGEVLNRPKDNNTPGIGEREIGDAILFK